MDDVLYGYTKMHYTDYNYCSTSRTFAFMCGENGKHYEQNELI